MLSTLAKCPRELCQLNRALYYIEMVRVKQSVATGGRVLEEDGTSVLTSIL